VVVVVVVVLCGGVFLMGKKKRRREDAVEVFEDFVASLRDCAAHLDLYQKENLVVANVLCSDRRKCTRRSLVLFQSLVDFEVGDYAKIRLGV
jgi:hypothetical protein